MANIPFISGRCGYLSLKVGATQMDIMCIGGTGYTIGDNDVLEELGLGAADCMAAPRNILTGLFTPVLNVSCRVHESWFTGTNICDMFGGSAGVLATRVDPYGNLPLMYAKFSNGYDVVQDTVKLATFSLEAGSSSNAMVCNMTFLGMNESGGSFNQFSASLGAPLYWKNISTITWEPGYGEPGAGTVFDIAGTVQALTVGIATGLSYGKVADADNNPSYLDPLASLATSFTITQRTGAGGTSGAYQRMLNTRNGILRFEISNSALQDHVMFELGGNRQGRRVSMSPAGGLVDNIAYQGYAVPYGVLGNNSVFANINQA